MTMMSFRTAALKGCSPDRLERVIFAHLLRGGRLDDPISDGKTAADLFAASGRTDLIAVLARFEVPGKAKPAS